MQGANHERHLPGLCCRRSCCTGGLPPSARRTPLAYAPSAAATCTCPSPCIFENAARKDGHHYVLLRERPYRCFRSTMPSGNEEEEALVPLPICTLCVVQSRARGNSEPPPYQFLSMRLLYLKKAFSGLRPPGRKTWYCPCHMGTCLRKRERDETFNAAHRECTGFQICNIRETATAAIHRKRSTHTCAGMHALAHLRVPAVDGAQPAPQVRPIRCLLYTSPSPRD